VEGLDLALDVAERTGTLLTLLTFDELESALAEAAVLDGSGFGLGGSTMRSRRILGLLGWMPNFLLPKRLFICDILYGISSRLCK
jgi:hypothetical protein